MAIDADGQGTPKQVRRVIDEVRRNSTPVVFYSAPLATAWSESMGALPMSAERHIEIADLKCSMAMTDVSWTNRRFLPLSM